MAIIEVSEEELDKWLKDPSDKRLLLSQGKIYGHGIDDKLYMFNYKPEMFAKKEGVKAN
jgi:hypothetical protein